MLKFIPLILPILMMLGCAHLSGNPAAREPSYDELCEQQTVEYDQAFRSTTYQGRTAFVSHPLLTIEYLRSLHSLCRKNKTHVDDAKTWFQQNNIPVASQAYFGCVSTRYGKKSKLSSLAQKLDKTTWLVLSFGGYGSPDGYFSTAYLLKKNDRQDRWIEEDVLSDLNCEFVEHQEPGNRQ